MNTAFTFRLQRDDLTPALRHIASSIGEDGERRAVVAMADAFYRITDKNFGQVGYKRAEGWKELSYDYARKVGRVFATLEKTGNMRSALRAELVANNTTRVYIDEGQVPYAARHHFGIEGMPRRPIMPIDTFGNIIPSAREEVVGAAEMALQSMMEGSGGAFFS